MLHHELLDDNEAHVESGAEASRNQAAVIGDSPRGDTNTIPSRDIYLRAPYSLDKVSPRVRTLRMTPHRTGCQANHVRAAKRWKWAITKVIRYRRAIKMMQGPTSIHTVHVYTNAPKLTLLSCVQTHIPDLRSDPKFHHTFQPWTAQRISLVTRDRTGT